MLRTRLATAAVALPSLFWLIFWGPNWAFAGLVVALLAIGLGEFSSMAFPDHRRMQAYCLASGLALAWAVISGGSHAIGQVLSGMLGVGLLLALTDRDMEGAVSRLSAAVFGAVYVGFLLAHVVAIRLVPEGGPRWVFYAVGAGMAVDTAGYFVGRYFGKTKLFERVSPKKTVEGAIGSLVGCLTFSVLLQATYPPPGLTAAGALWMGLAIAVMAVAGDMVESLLKRAYGTKDAGWVIPGHGGVLDRIDSLVLPFVFTYYWIV